MCGRVLSVLCLQKKRKNNPIDRDDKPKKRNTAELIAGLSKLDEEQVDEEQIVSDFLKSDDDCNSRCVCHHDSVWFVCV